MGLSRFRRRTRLFCAVVASALAATCTSRSEPFEQVLWEGHFTPRPGADALVTGSIGMVSNVNSTEIGLAIRGTEATHFSWAVRSGTCSGTGEAIAPRSAFPPLTLDDEGAGGARAVLSHRIEDRPSYAAELFAESQGTERVQACAELTRRD